MFTKSLVFQYLTQKTALKINLRFGQACKAKFKGIVFKISLKTYENK